MIIEKTVKELTDLLQEIKDREIEIAVASEPVKEALGKVRELEALNEKARRSVRVVAFRLTKLLENTPDPLKGLSISDIE